MRHLFSLENLTQNLTRWLRRFKLQKRTHFKNGGRRIVLDDLSCADFRDIYAKEKVTLADDAFDVSSDQENATEYGNPVDPKWLAV